MTFMHDYDWLDTVTYTLYTDQQGMVGDVEVEVSCDMDEDEIIQAIREDLALRIDDWYGDDIWGVYEGDTIYPDDDDDEIPW